MRAILVIAALCVASCDAPQRESFCDVTFRTGAFNGAQIRIEANGTFTRHGAMLSDPRCSDRVILWYETNEFRETHEADELGRMAGEEQFGAFRDIRVDVTGIFLSIPEQRSPIIVVQRVHSLSPVPGTERIHATPGSND